MQKNGPWDIKSNFWHHKPSVLRGLTRLPGHDPGFKSQIHYNGFGAIVHAWVGQDVSLTCMVQGGHVDQVGGALKVLAEQAVRPEQGGTAHAAPGPELAPHSTSDSQAWITRHTNHLYPVGLVMLADLAVAWLHLPIPVTKYKVKAVLVHMQTCCLNRGLSVSNCQSDWYVQFALPR